MRRKSENEVQVESYRGHSIILNKGTSKFYVLELAEVPPADTVQAAKNAVDRQIAGLNKGVRRKVLTLRENYDDGREIREAELTSWSRSRSYGNRLEGIVMYADGGRDNLRPDEIFEDTPENRALLAMVTELDKAAIKAKAAAEKIIEKELKTASVPTHFLKEK